MMLSLVMFLGAFMKCESILEDTQLLQGEGHTMIGNFEIDAALAALINEFKLKRHELEEQHRIDRNESLFSTEEVRRKLAKFKQDFTDLQYNNSIEWANTIDDVDECKKTLAAIETGFETATIMSQSTKSELNHCKKDNLKMKANHRHSVDEHQESIANCEKRVRSIVVDNKAAKSSHRKEVNDLEEDVRDEEKKLADYVNGP